MAWKIWMASGDINGVADMDGGGVGARIGMGDMDKGRENEIEMEK